MADIDKKLEKLVAGDKWPAPLGQAALAIALLRARALLDEIREHYCEESCGFSERAAAEALDDKPLAEALA